MFWFNIGVLYYSSSASSASSALIPGRGNRVVAGELFGLGTQRGAKASLFASLASWDPRLLMQSYVQPSFDSPSPLSSASSAGSARRAAAKGSESLPSPLRIRGSLCLDASSPARVILPTSTDYQVPSLLPTALLLAQPGFPYFHRLPGALLATNGSSASPAQVAMATRAARGARSALHP
ncbi:hypothetical protein RSAG8_13056, partial [Rhizoctonia solani AG-8 WAC10335]